jgi:hypothetical protein
MFIEFKKVTPQQDSLFHPQYSLFCFQTSIFSAADMDLNIPMTLFNCIRQ